MSDKGQGYYNHLASYLFPRLQQTVIGSNKMHDLCMSGHEVQDCAEQVSPLAACLHNKGSNRIIQNSQYYWDAKGSNFADKQLNFDLLRL